MFERYVTLPIYDKAATFIDAAFVVYAMRANRCYRPADAVAAAMLKLVACSFDTHVITALMSMPASFTLLRLRLMIATFTRYAAVDGRSLLIRHVTCCR